MLNLDPLTAKKDRLDQLRPFPFEALRSLEAWFRVELTYTSNALEGNTLNRRETALVLEKGLTVGGKSLVEHLEAKNHAAALDWLHSQLKPQPHQIGIQDVLKIHEMILKGIEDQHAGRFRSVPVRISGSTVVLPNPQKVPELMNGFISWLKGSKKLHPVELASEAHYRLVSIHPFVDGNGRTARLLMNLILMRGGYPPAIIRKRDRLAYLVALEKAQLGGSKDDYERLIGKSVNRSLDIYLQTLADDRKAQVELDQEPLMKIGELAKKAGETLPTIRHWTKEALLEVAEVTTAGYQMYAPEMLERVKTIQKLKEKRLTLKEIKRALHEQE
ncbi:MAG: MerR family transcriptional regulator [Bradymonadales bacterium]|nr:MAG: MerR family transcriptional regulator [Bradymonadales bacterium]